MFTPVGAMPHNTGAGHITLVCGPMRSGKSTWMINYARAQVAAARSCVVVKYKQDKRHPAASDELLTTYNNETQIKAIACEKHLETVYDTMMLYEVVCIDEGQFYDDLDVIAERLAKNGKLVCISALDGDYKREAFGKVCQLIPKCESFFKLSAVCVGCRQPAAFTARHLFNADLEVIGDLDIYGPKCRGCHTVPTPSMNLQPSNI